MKVGKIVSEEKRIDVLEPDDSKQPLNSAACLALLHFMLEHMKLKPHHRERLKELRADLFRRDLAGGVADFFRDFTENEAMTKLIAHSLGIYVRSRSRIKRKQNKH